MAKKVTTEYGDEAGAAEFPDIPLQNQIVLNVRYNRTCS
jgi:hypothetical protein